MGAVTEVLYRQKVEKAPMLVFDQIPGYPAGMRTAYGMFGSPFRLATVLGMDPAMSDDRAEMLNYFRKNIKRAYKQIAPEVVTSGPDPCLAQLASRASTTKRVVL